MQKADRSICLTGRPRATPDSLCGRISPLLLCALMLAGCESTGPSPELDRHSQEKNRHRDVPIEQWREVEFELPAYPTEENLAPFQIRGNASFEFLADTQSVRIDSDGVVRFTLVARSPAGAENVTFEGMHCEKGLFRVYALGSAAGEWIAVQDPEWKPIEQKTSNDVRYTLYRHYLCPWGFPHARARDAVLALKHGKPTFISR